MNIFRELLSFLTTEDNYALTQLAVSQAALWSFIQKGRDGAPWIKSVLASHLGETARGSVFSGTEQDVLSLFGESEWRLVDKTNGTAIFEVHPDKAVGQVGAIELGDVPLGTKVKVEALGDHPTLVPVGEFDAAEVLETNIATLIVEYSGDEYENDVKALGWTQRQPIIATFFPGYSLPRSYPFDCEVGDELTVNEALKKGWRVLKILKG